MGIIIIIGIHNIVLQFLSLLALTKHKNEGPRAHEADDGTREGYSNA